MPTLVKLQWHKATKRWRKKINGKDYYFDGGKGTNKSNLDGYRVAFSEYENLCRQLNSSITAHQPVTNQDKLNWLNATGKTLEASELAKEIKATETAIANGTYKTAEPDFVNGSGSQFYADDNAMWRERIQTLNTVVGNVQGATIAEAVRLFDESNLTRCQSKKISPQRLYVLRRTMSNIAEFLGSSLPANSINSMAVTKVYGKIISNTEWSEDYEKSHWVIFKMFVNWCWENEVIENLPRNLKSKSFTFGEKGKQPREKVIFSKEQIATILAKGTDQIKLFTLLCLNCGFTQIDLAELTKAEVDLANGRIIRKRSKTRKQNSSLTINYKLWPETLALLKKVKSKHKTLVFATRNGTPLMKAEFNAAGKFTRKDNISLEYNRFQVKTFGKRLATFKSLRKTGNSALNGTEYRDMRTYYLGHSPRSVAEKHYDVGDPDFQKRLDNAIDCLRVALGIK